MNSPPDPPTPDEIERLRNESNNRFWLGFWAIATVGAIVTVNALLAWAGDYSDSFRELSTLAITGVLAAGANNTTHRQPR